MEGNPSRSKCHFSSGRILKIEVLACLLQDMIHSLGTNTPDTTSSTRASRSRLVPARLSLRLLAHTGIRRGDLWLGPISFTTLPVSTGFGASLAGLEPRNRILFSTTAQRRNMPSWPALILPILYLSLLRVFFDRRDETIGYRHYKLIVSTSITFKI